MTGAVNDRAVIEEACPGVFHELRVDPDSTADEALRELDDALAASIVGASSLLVKPCDALQTLLNGSIGSQVARGCVHLPRHDAFIALRPTGQSPTHAERRFALPLSLSDAAALYEALAPSLVGVEGRGDVLDATLRRSHEVEAAGVTLPARLANFSFADEVQRIHANLCPSALELRIEPYKLVVYGKGDFFIPHRDAMDRADMLGTISLILPVDPASGDGEDDEAEDSESGRVYYGMPRAGQPGSLVVYAGYHSSYDPHVEVTQGAELRPENCLTYTIDMERVAHVVDDGLLTATEATVPMSYGAWTSDVLHEVRRVRRGYRAALIYRVYKVGCRESFVPLPLRREVEALVIPLMSRLREARAGDYTHALYLGFALRHGYPPAGLVPSALKGVDAVVYNIVSYHFDTVLFTGYDTRFADMRQAHTLVASPLARHIFFTTDTPAVELDWDDTTEQMAALYPLLTNVLWVQLGYGTLPGGGCCYGNADCGTNWWYRQGYLLLSHRPSRWRRARPLLLLIHHGPMPWRQLRAVVDTVVEFL